MAEHDPSSERQEQGSREVHGRLALPLLIPAVVFLFSVLVVYGLSRIYLELDTYEVGDVSMATPLAIGVSLFILLIAAYLAAQRTISVFQIGGIFVVSAALLTAGGVWAAVHEESTGEHVPPPVNGGTPGPDGQGMQVSLIDPSWAVTVDPPATGPGPVTFVVTNDGTLIHNFHAALTELAPGALPVDAATFQVDVSQLDIVAETAEIAAGQSAEATADLASGAYVVFCNVPAHYESGMYTAFTVE